MDRKEKMKDAYYFSHDAHARHDPKILKLRAAMGWEGYGLFWALMELLREQADYKIESNDKQLLSYCLYIDETTLDKFINICIETGLIVSDSGYLYSKSLLRRMKRLDEIKVKRAFAGSKGGSKTQAKRKQKSSSIVKFSKVKQSKAKQSKEKKITTTTGGSVCDISEEKNPDEAFENTGPFTVFSKCDGKMNDITHGLLTDLIKQHGSPAVSDAIRIAAKRDKVNIAYIEGILKKETRRAGSDDPNVPF